MNIQKFRNALILVSYSMVVIFLASTIAGKNETIRQLRSEALAASVDQECNAIEVNSRRLRMVDALSRLHQVPTDLTRPVVEAALAHDLDPYVLGRLVSIESSWRPHAVSHRGAYGLAQVRLETARGYDPSLTSTDLLDPSKSVWIGAWYYRSMLDRYDEDHFKALRAYNAGPTRIARDDRVSRRYATRVLGGTHESK